MIKIPQPKNSSRRNSSLQNQTKPGNALSAGMLLIWLMYYASNTIVPNHDYSKKFSTRNAMEQHFSSKKHATMVKKKKNAKGGKNKNKNKNKKKQKNKNLTEAKNTNQPAAATTTGCSIESKAHPSILHSASICRLLCDILRTNGRRSRAWWYHWTFAGRDPFQR